MLSTFLAIGLAPLLATAQLSGSVGPTTSYATKADNKICSVLDYGGVADNSTDVGAAIASAWDECKDGGVVYIPPGDYALDTWVRLTGGSSCAINIDGTLYRTGTDGGNMIYIEHTTDFELLSSTSQGAIQAFGYEFHAEGSTSGPRILRLYDVVDFSVHDLILVDSPSFHFSIDTCENGEVYNMIIRGGNEGGLDGIDVWSTNIWIHDVRLDHLPTSFSSLLIFYLGRSHQQGRVCHCQGKHHTVPRDESLPNADPESCPKHLGREHLLQLEWWLCHGLIVHRCQHLRYHLSEHLYLVIQPDVHDQEQRW